MIGASHKELIDYIMSKDKGDQDPPECLNLWEDWFIEDENCVKRRIFAPAIYPGAKFISWRWRRTEINLIGDERGIVTRFDNASSFHHTSLYLDTMHPSN